MSTVTLNRHKRFTAESGISLLDAAAHSGITLAYSCRTGRCGACRCRVLTGVTTIIQAEIGLTEDERQAGWILSCARAAVGGVALEADEVPSGGVPLARTWPCKIYEISRYTPEIIRVILRLPPSAKFRYLPGQHIDVIGPLGLRRSYSIANAHHPDGLLELHIRIVEGGAFSRYWFGEAKTNDLLRIHGPLGTFFLRDSAGIDLIFMATGTGIAPIKSMLESLAGIGVEGAPRSVKVVWGSRHRDDFYINPQEFGGEIEFVPVNSRPDASWRGEAGYVQDALLRMKVDWQQSAVYACGSERMIQSARGLLAGSGLAPDRFYSDAFVPSSSVGSPE